MNANRTGASKLPIGQNLSLFFYFLSGDVVNKIPTYSVAHAEISNSSVCNVCVFHTMVFRREIQWCAVLWFLV